MTAVGGAGPVRGLPGLLLRTGARAGAAAVGALLRRAAVGPRAPGRPLALEIVCDAQRAALRTLVRADPAAARTLIERTLTRGRPDPRVTREPVGLAGVPAERFTGPGAETGAPWVLYLHGGGFAFGSPRTHAELTAELARRIPARVVSVDYRLAPEHPHPAALEDALAAWRGLLAEGAETRRLALGGDSAGGGLALALLQRLRDSGEPLPAAAFLISPWVDLGSRGASFERNRATDYLDADMLSVWSERYRAGRDPADPAVSPLRGDLRGLPPLRILAGEAEVLRDPIAELAEKAERAGVPVERDFAPGMPHDWPLLRGIAPDAERALDELALFVRRRTGAQP